MKTAFHTFLLGAALLSAFHGKSYAQTGNDNLTGPAGIFNGDITTAGDVDPYTANTRRWVTDIAVAGAVGTQPLALVRTANSRGVGQNAFGDGYGFGSAGGWSHNYQWSMWASTNSPTHDFAPPSYWVFFPDGRSVTFYPPNPGTDIYYRAGAGVHERFIPMNPSGGNFLSYLLLVDGSKVEFTATEVPVGSNPTYYYYTYLASAIIDPYGLRTTLTYNSNGLLVKERAGRTLQFYNTTTAWGDKVIDRVTASDGRTVQYTYKHNAMAGATQPYTYLDSVTYYGDSTLVAHYTYQKPNIPDGGGTYNGLPLLSTCVDPMYAGPMWMIAYTYATTANTDGSAAVYGQIKSENYFNGTTVGGAVSTLKVNNTAQTRTETRGDAATATRTFTYAGSLLSKATDFNGITASQGYDGNSYVNSVTDRNGNTTRYTLNPLTGRPVFVQFPATPNDGQPTGSSLTYTYGWANCPDPNNRDPNNPYYLYSATDEGGHSTIYLRDTNKRVQEIDYPDGEKETFAYNPFGEVIQHSLTTGQIESYTYDGRGLKTEYRDPYHDPVAKAAKPNFRYKYDALDRVSDVTDASGANLADPAHTTSYTYNKRGQVLTLTHPKDPNDGIRHFIQNGYNTNGNGTLTSVTDELNHTTSYVYDDYKRLLTMTTPIRGFGDTNAHTTTYNYTRPGTTSPYWHTANFPFVITSPAARVVNKTVTIIFGRPARSWPKARPTTTPRPPSPMTMSVI